MDGGGEYLGGDEAAAVREKMIRALVAVGTQITNDEAKFFPWRLDRARASCMT
jgi:hypothetical protein